MFSKKKYKKIISLLVCFVLLSYNLCFGSGSNLRVAVIPWFVKDVGRVLGFSEDLQGNSIDYFQGDLIIRNGFKPSINKYQYNETEKLKFMFSAPITNFPDKLDAEILVSGTLTKRGVLEIKAVGVESGREIITNIALGDLTKENFVESIDDAVSKMLSYSKELIGIYCDKVIDPRKSIVSYVIPSDEGDDIVFYFDYDGLHEYLQDSGITLKNKKGDGKYIYSLTDTEGQKVTLNVIFKNGAVSEYVFQVKQTNLDKREIILLSKSGYGLTIALKDKDGDLSEQKMRPLQNPYLPYVIE